MTQTKHWVSIWGNAAGINENRPEQYAKNITLRYPIYVPFANEALRLTFDNLCGTEDVTISKVTVCYQGNFYPVTYCGKQEMSILAGEKIVTDELELHVEGDETIEVNMYFADYVQMRAAVCATGPLCTGQYAIGDHTETLDLPAEVTKPAPWFYFLTNISVLTAKENRAIVCFGDSITAQPWPDYLKLRLKEEGYQHTAVVRRAISGSRILRQYDCISMDHYGIAGVRRFPHDVPTDGADTVIILHGINDIIHPVGEGENIFRPWSDLPTVDDLIEGFKQYVKVARELGYKVYAGTILPMKGWRTDAPFRQEIRHAYNAFLRTTDLVDGIIDFDKVMQNPDDTDRLIEAYDSGDHLHPGQEGAKKMAMTIPKELLK